jgi:deoxyribonuclease-4
MSVAGGLEKAVERGIGVGCRTLQIFTRNSNQWAGKPVTDDEAAGFRTAVDAAGLFPVVSHSAYLINLGSGDATIRRRSAVALAEELVRCERLGVPFVVLHPGSHGGDGEETGIDRIAKGLDEALETSGTTRPAVLLETAAGQGASVGHTFAQLRAIRDRAATKARLAVCLDTCHMHAAGYDLVSRDGWRRTMEELDSLLGLSLVRVIHVNDSKKARGCRVDRHERIGRGAMGEAAFGHLMTEPAFEHVPKILETPKDAAGDWDREGLAVLRRMASPPRRRGGTS